jgi:hypothetical protein
MTVAAAAPPAIVFRLPAGPARRTFWVTRPAGVVVLTRIAVPRGARAKATIVVPGIGGVAVDTSGVLPGRCTLTRNGTVCVQSQEACPFPAARWRIAVVKRVGPAGVVRVDFRVGEPA